MSTDTDQIDAICCFDKKAALPALGKLDRWAKNPTTFNTGECCDQVSNLQFHAWCYLSSGRRHRFFWMTGLASLTFTQPSSNTGDCTLCERLTWSTWKEQTAQRAKRVALTCTHKAKWVWLKCHGVVQHFLLPSFYVWALLSFQSLLPWNRN